MSQVSARPVSSSVHDTSSTTGALFVLAASALWGTTGTVATFAPEGASAVSIGAATMGIGGLLTFAVAARGSLAVLRDHRARRLAVIGGLCVLVYPLAFYSAMAFAGVAIGTLINIGSSPLFAALYERFFDGARLSRRWLLATLAAFTGCVVLVSGGHPVDGSDTDLALGIVLGLVGGATYAGLSYLATRIMRQGHSSQAAMGALFGLGALGLLPILAATGAPLLSAADGWVVSLYLAVVPMCVAYLLFGAGLRRVGASTGTTLSLFETMVAAALSVLVVGERLGLVSWSGMVLIGIGLVVITVRFGHTIED
ncbi:DME family drug/metabolite transporter [Stackebrandtia endophytica]|uniref:DME family drug/metabolite transporter n=1 Tax=Stackebrandtia endophytica TaxID=1496996 RepID=A0A543B2M9_9ACTN|nr:EamA family transporter [Stackebrandtia endophytica]TQL79078.1 DME family drug/metabolite transporter [Stackebrandtia endophytica]